jgi:hypothetical protein
VGTRSRRICRGLKGTLAPRRVSTPARLHQKRTELQHKLEKAQLMIEQRDKEIDYLKQQMSDFRDIINMLKKS